MRRIFTIFIVIFICCLSAAGKSKIVNDFTPACDSLATLILERSGIKGPVKLQSVMKRGGNLDFYFTESLGDFPWYKTDIKWLRSTLKSLFPDEYKKYHTNETEEDAMYLVKASAPINSEAYANAQT